MLGSIKYETVKELADIALAEMNKTRSTSFQISLQLPDPPVWVKIIISTQPIEAPKEGMEL